MSEAPLATVPVFKTLQHNLLNMMGLQRTCAAIYATAFACSLVLCFAPIPVWGVIGAALAPTVCIVLESVMIYLTIRRKFGIRALNSFGEPAA
ncbi:polysaccharide biosynthesis C-terminal domain-containing protein [Mesorhizobium sp. ANAO-SY3R2]|uniref:polysaccharide biosynthesis C-terminal domain-containing protein n=1 Tax=Mesorhizobium sp. ANAO-SY3R2 TaxID=3166644 RepID=UPI00367282AC